MMRSTCPSWQVVGLLKAEKARAKWNISVFQGFPCRNQENMVKTVLKKHIPSGNLT
jgi:hypothetical protein